MHRGEKLILTINFYETMDALECLKTRRSIRAFKSDPVPKDVILEILECGRWAPSGMNLQPWRVVVISDPGLKAKLAECTKYTGLINSAPHTFAIFMDGTAKYNRVKSIQGIGAFFENLLLAIHAKGLGAVWIGEIYNQKECVYSVLEIKDPNLEFMGAIPFGYSDQKNPHPSRNRLEDFILEWK